MLSLWFQRFFEFQFNSLFKKINCNRMLQQRIDAKCGFQADNQWMIVGVAERSRIIAGIQDVIIDANLYCNILLVINFIVLNESNYINTIVFFKTYTTTFFVSFHETILIKTFCVFDVFLDDYFENVPLSLCLYLKFAFSTMLIVTFMTVFRDGSSISVWESILYLCMQLCLSALEK